MMPTAYAALGIFAAALVFLVFAMRRPRATVHLALRLSLLPHLAPKVARVLEDKLLEMIRGFDVLRDGKNLLAFTAWSIAYWVANGVSLWLLARGFHIDLSMIGAFATMGLVAVGITLPNSPGLVGQYQWFTMLGLSLYLGHGVLDDGTAINGLALAFSICLHLIQVIWYMAMGALGMASRHVSFADLRRARKLDPDAAASDAAGQ